MTNGREARRRRRAVERTAHERGLALLGRRARTESELREALVAEGHPAEEVRDALHRLRELGYLDDRRLAARTILDHVRRGRAAGGALGELERRGVSPEVIREAWEAAQAEHGLDPREQLRERLEHCLRRAGPLRDRRSIRRVYNQLLRAGFEEEQVRSALEPFLDSGETDAGAGAGGLGPARRRPADTRTEDDRP